MQTAVRAVTVQVAPDGSLQGVSVTYDVTLPDGSIHQDQLDVTPWAKTHQTALSRMLTEVSATIRTRFA